MILYKFFIYNIYSKYYKLYIINVYIYIFCLENLKIYIYQRYISIYNIYIYMYIYIYIYIYIQIESHKIAKCVSIKRKLKKDFFLQIFWCLYAIFYSVKWSNILQKGIVTALINSKLNKIKV